MKNENETTCVFCGKKFTFVKPEKLSGKNAVPLFCSQTCESKYKQYCESESNETIKNR